MHATRQSSLNKNKVWYTASQVACGWAGAVMKKANQAFGQEQQCSNAKPPLNLNAVKSKVSRTEHPSDR